MAWQMGMYHREEILRMLTDGDIAIADIKYLTPFNSTTSGILFYAHDTNPPTLLDAETTNINGDPIYVEHYNECFIIIEKSGAGTCTVTLQHRVKDGTWYDIPDGAGGYLEYAFAAGVQSANVLVNVVGLYEVRAVITLTAGAISVSSKLSGGI